MFAVKFKQRNKPVETRYAFSPKGVQRHLANKHMQLAEYDPDYKSIASAIRTTKNIHEAFEIFSDYWDHRSMGADQCKATWTFDGR